MSVKFKVGKTYRIQNRGYWSGHVKVLRVNEDGDPCVILTKLITGGEDVQEFFDARGKEGAWLGHIDWQQREVNMTLENK